MPLQKLSVKNQHTLGLSASKKSLTSSPSVGTMVAGFTRSQR